MTDNVIQLVHSEGVGDGYVVPPDQILDQAAGKYETLVIVGERPDGEIEVCASHGAGDAVLLLEWAKTFLVQNRTLRA